MHPQHFVPVLIPLSLAVLTVNPPPSLAHQVELAADVGATLHIEPDDTPKAGEPTKLWFALTRKGGEIIPLADCDCQLTIYTPTSGADPILEPALIPIAAEGYEAIPGANLTFPAVGAYELVLRGQSQQSGDFAPFELRFDVLVAAGSGVEKAEETEDAIAALETPTESPTPPETAARSPWPIVGIVGGVALLGIVGGVLWKQRQNS